MYYPTNFVNILIYHSGPKNNVQYKFCNESFAKNVQSHMYDL